MYNNVLNSQSLKTDTTDVTVLWVQPIQGHHRQPVQSGLHIQQHTQPYLQEQWNRNLQPVFRSWIRLGI